MPVTNADQEQVTRLLIQDLAATTGHRHEALVQRDATHVRQYHRTRDSYIQRVVDDVQQRLHDERIDTDWPRCPRHLRHPLWFKDGWWWCEKDNIQIARLGELGGLL